MHQDSATTQPEPIRYRSIVLIVLAWGALSAISLLAIVFGLYVLNDANSLPAELILTVVFIASVVILLIGLAVTAVVFQRLRLSNRKHPMGLPEGSIRAIIALMLIVIFALVGVFLISNVDNRSTSEYVTGQTQAQVDAYPAEDVISTSPEKDSPPAESTFTVRLRGTDPASLEMSQQLLTTLGTLVVAVAAFYFGSQSVLPQRIVTSSDDDDVK